MVDVLRKERTMVAKAIEKEFKIHYWDTFDDETFEVGETHTLQEARDFVQFKYKDQLRSDGADMVDIVHRGNVCESFNVG